VQAYLYPEPRLALGVHLARNKAASSCMDLSDGLADGLRQIAEASGVGLIVDVEALPIDPAARAVFARHAEDALAQAICAGDDYELIFTVRPRTQRRLAAAERRGGAPITRIGRCTAEPGVTLRLPGGAVPIDVAALPHGFRHFR
jgi:thiamine-monophosphate kinase